jgi:DNA invertase Pin-like site-specific DNA recombinase
LAAAVLLGAHRTMAAGLLGVALGAAGLATMAASGGLPPTMVAGFVLSGLGLGVASVASTAKGTAAVPPARQGLASGVLNTAAQVGTALGLAVLVTVASTRTGALTPPGARPSPAAVVGGYRWAILAGLAVALAAAGATAPRGGRCRSRRRAPPPGPNPAWLRGDKTMTKRYTPRTHVRSRARGLWRMAAEPGPEFRWGLVVRRSTLNQEGTEGSTERQRLVLTNHIKTNNMGRIVWTYKDIASAYKEDAKRPEFENAMLDLRAGRIDGIASWRPDRLVRRVSQFRQVMLDLEKSGGRLLFLRPMVIDTADTENLAFTTIFLDFLVAFAQMEAEATADRMVIWHQDRARQGLPHRSQVRPFGHTLDWFALVPHEAQLLNDAARRIIAGGNRFAICKEWEDSNIPTVLGKRWHGETLKQILMSPLMVGKREIGGTLHDMEGVPPILDMETWERVREALSNGKSRPGGRAPRRQASNIMVCGDCETPIVGNVEGPHSRETYVCRKRHAYPNACGGVSALVAHVDGEIANRVCEFLNQRDRVLTLLRQHAQGAELDALHARNEQLNDSLVALDEARFNPPPGMPRLPDDRYWTQAAAIYAEQDQIQRKLAVTREASLLTETLSVDWTPELWGEQDLAWRRAILKLVTLSITLHKATKRGTRSGLYGSEFDPERVHVEFAS